MTIVCKPGEFSRIFVAREARRLTGVRRAVVLAAGRGVEVVRDNEPVDLANMRKATEVWPGERPSEVARIVVDAPYAAAQEVGTRPFTPPIAPLVAWASRHGAADNDEAWAMAYGIQKAIATRGIRATWFASKSMPVLVDLIVREIAAELARFSTAA